MAAITVRLDGMAHTGEAMGRHEGQPILVPLGIPGELVRVAVEERRRRFWRGRILEVLEPSPERVRPPCPYFGVCGGCQWQHLSYPAQLAWKQRLIERHLRRPGMPDVEVPAVLGMEEPWAYRNHVQLMADASGGLGYLALRSHDVVAATRAEARAWGRRAVAALAPLPAGPVRSALEDFTTALVDRRA